MMEEYRTLGWILVLAFSEQIRLFRQEEGLGFQSAAGSEGLSMKAVATSEHCHLI